MLSVQAVLLKKSYKKQMSLYFLGYKFLKNESFFGNRSK